jgi:hypothetical protein
LTLAQIASDGREGKEIVSSNILSHLPLLLEVGADADADGDEHLGQHNQP